MPPACKAWSARLIQEAATERGPRQSIVCASTRPIMSAL